MDKLGDMFEKWFNSKKERKSLKGDEHRKALTACANRACEMMRREPIRKRKPAKKKPAVK